MPLFSDQITNMYYSGSQSYNSSPYNYSSKITPLGTSFSASYLNPGGNYSSHSSLGGYSRVPLSSRWLTSSGRTYSPMLSTISEKGSLSPVRINSPRRAPITARSYVSTAYTSRPININTADIDVSRDKYNTREQNSNASPNTGLPSRRDSPLNNKENGHDKPDTGIDTSPGIHRSMIKRDRAVVRLHTLKRKERDSPRKPLEDQNNNFTINSSETDIKEKEKQQDSKKWRQKLADDLVYKTQKEKKTLGAMLVEKFTLKEKVEDEYDNSTKQSPNRDKSPVIQENDKISSTIKSSDRRCSMELLAEQASLLDSLIRRENLSTAPLDLSKVGTDYVKILEVENKEKRKTSIKENCLTTTKSDHSLHHRLSSKASKDPIFRKRKSLRKCSSSGNVHKLDCIKENPKKATAINLPLVENVNISNKMKNIKPKMKTKITSTVEITPTTPQIKFIVENVTVEEKTRPCKKDIIYSSTLDDNPPILETEIEESHRKNIKLNTQTKPRVTNIQSNIDSKKMKLSDKDKKCPTTEITQEHRKSIKSKEKEKLESQIENTSNLTSPEPDDGNFWEKIGKRETVYLINRKQNLEEIKKQNKHSLSWYPSEECIVQNRDEKGTTAYNEKTNVELLKEPAEVQSVDKFHEIYENIDTLMSDKDLKSMEAKEKQKVIIENEVRAVARNENESKIVNTKILSQIEIKKDILDTENISSTGNTFSTVEMNKTDRPDDEPITIVNISKFLNKNEKEIEFQNNKVSVHFVIPSDINKKFEKNTNTSKSNDDKEENVHEKNLNENFIDNSTPQVKSVTNLNEISSKDMKLSTVQGDKHAFIANENSKNYEKVSAANSITMKETNIKKKIEDTTNLVLEIPEKTKDIIAVETGNKNISYNTTTTAINKSLNQAIPKVEIDDLKNKNQDVELEFLDTATDTVTTVKIENDDIKNKHEDDIKSIEKIETIKNYPNVESTEKKNVPQVDMDSVDANKNNNKGEIKVSLTNVGIVKSKNSIQNKLEPVSSPNANLFANMKPAKEEKALKPLIATPRPLQKRNPQTIRSSSSESSDDDTTDDETEDEDTEGEEKTGSSQGSAEFVECENNPDGRTSTGSNDSGFDSSAPTSPSGFLHAKKDCDVNCHRKCEKLMANLCGVDQRLLVEALASRTTSKRGGDNPSTSTGTATSQIFTRDILEQELEHSTAYDLYRKTGRFTPPARSIPRFRKYTIEDFQFIKVLGKGSFGKVMLAELRDTEYYYAVKCLKKDVVLEDDDVECTLIERKVLALGTNHPYLCHLFATFQTDSHLFFVMEYLNGGDLMFHIQQSGRFPEIRGRFYAAEIVSGLKFLHKRGIVYRDLKLDNILLDFDGHVRIADFGMCKLQIYLDKTADTFCGTPDYMAPEIIKGLKYNQTVDWWSFGVLLYEMLIGQSPFSGCDEDELFWSICNEMPSYPRFLSKESLTILTRLLDKDAKTRLGGPECMHGDIRDQEFFKPIHWDRLERRELEAPFKPRVRHPMDTQYFDRAFTGERPRLTAVEPQVLRSMDQEPFRGFSYTNPNATDR